MPRYYNVKKITVTMDDGTMLTHTYEGWAKETGDLKCTIQKRMSHRNKQIRDGVTPYTLREVVGIDKLKTTTEVKKEKIRPEVIMSFQDKFLSRRLVRESYSDE